MARARRWRARAEEEAKGHNCELDHVSAEGMSLLKHTTDVAIRRKDEMKGSTELLKQDFVRNVIELHEKYMSFVTNCFQDSTLFRKALKESFEVFCNKDVGCSSAELFAAYCESILKKGGSDEDVETALDKAVKVLTYLSNKDLFAEFHRKKFMIRFLFERNINVAHERIIFSKITQFFGGGGGACFKNGGNAPIYYNGK
uniref:Cullin family profile domain-containing protein n=1 Tax=Oryza brachyantha TaxID=4533 RepID=J3KZY0_ORYBR